MQFMRLRGSERVIRIAQQLIANSDLLQEAAAENGGLSVHVGEELQSTPQKHTQQTPQPQARSVVTKPNRSKRSNRDRDVKRRMVAFLNSVTSTVTNRHLSRTLGAKYDSVSANCSYLYQLGYLTRVTPGKYSVRTQIPADISFHRADRDYRRAAAIAVEVSIIRQQEAGRYEDEVAEARKRVSERIP